MQLLYTRRDLKHIHVFVMKELQLLSIYLLVYADDMILFSESFSELQNMLNTIQNYTTEWSLDVHVQKTKFVVFRNGGKYP